MKFLKALLVIVLVLLIGYAVACFLGPKEMELSVSESMDAPPETVYAHVATLPTWEKWNVYTQMEGVKMSYGEKQKGEGATYSWTMDGKPGGNLEIIEAHPTDSLRVRLQFADWEGNSFVDWNFQPQGDSTNVSWKMTSDTETPFYMRGMMLFMEGSMKKDFEKSLQNLEEYSKSNPVKASAEYEVNMVERPVATYLGIRDEMPIDSMKAFFENSYAAIIAHIQEKQYEMSGAPVGIYYKWDMENNRTDLAAAIPVAGENLEGSETVKVIEVPAGNAAVINYYGDYANMMAPHEAMWEYLEENNLQQADIVIEEYVTDPMSEPDTTKWQTNIVYYVK